MQVLFTKAQNYATRKWTKWHHFPLDLILGTRHHFNDLKPCSFRPVAYSELSFREVLFGTTSLWLSPICKKLKNWHMLQLYFECFGVFMFCTWFIMRVLPQWRFPTSIQPKPRIKEPSVEFGCWSWHVRLSIACGCINS